MKEYSDEMLINKYIDDELNEKEAAVFKLRMETNPGFTAMLQDYIETETIMGKLSHNAREKKRIEFAAGYENFLMEQGLVTKTAGKKKAIEMNISQIVDAINSIPENVIDWLKQRFDVPNLLWNDLSNKIQQAMAVFLTNPAVIPIGNRPYEHGVSRSSDNLDILPEDAYVFEKKQSDTMTFSVHFLETGDDFAGNYKLKLFNNSLEEVIKPLSATMDNTQLQMNKNDYKLIFKIKCKNLSPGLYYWDLKKDKKLIIDKRYFFIID